ncbi:MAG TPA: hypothetical protein VN087_02690 [Verrucomicrobiae bacterium]|nr:hypothetical protein [Verrucomicrobiae bacterium]
MNQCKLSGYLVSDVSLRNLDDGGQMAAASLRFAKTSNPVFVVAVGERVSQLSGFRSGNAVVVTGKLAVDPTTNQFVIIVDVAGPWKMGEDRAGFKYEAAKNDQSTAQSFYALKLHAQMARVPGR